MIYRQTLDCNPKEVEEILARCYMEGAFSVEEQDIPGGMRLLVFYYDPVEGAEVVDESIDWQAISDKPWVPVEIGERWWLVPPGHEEETPEGRIRLEYLRGQAWGTGSHATSQCCLRAVEKYVHAGQVFVDIGIGSGILSIAARQLGAGTIAGCDIDHPSAAIAAKNTGEDVYTGSARSIRDESVDVAAANINAVMLTNLKDDLQRILKPGGFLIGSGFKIEETPKLGMEIVETFDQDGWRAAVYSKSGR